MVIVTMYVIQENTELVEHVLLNKIQAPTIVYGQFN